MHVIARRGCRCACGAVAPRPTPDAAHGRYRQRGQKALLGSGAHDGQPKRLIPLACDLCDRLVAAHANGTGHSQPCHAVACTPRNQQRVFGRKATRCDIDKGFVDGYALNTRGLVGENRHDLRAHLAVAVKVPVCPNGLRAQAPRLGRGHGRVHAKATRLIRTRGHDATRIGVSAHDERLSAPFG